MTDDTKRNDPPMEHGGAFVAGGHRDRVVLAQPIADGTQQRHLALRGHLRKP